MVRFVAMGLLAGLTTFAGVGCQKKPDDTAVAQGEWTVVSVELPDALDPAEQKERESVKELSVVVEGDRINITHAKEKGRLTATFTLDQTKSPREIDLTDMVVRGDGPEDEKITGTTRGIYKISGDEIILALPLGDGDDLPRPTDFKPAADKPNHRGVLVFHLKKK